MSMKHSWYGRVIRITSGLTFVRHKSTNWGIGINWFSGPSFRSINLEWGRQVYSLKLDGGYGYSEAYARIRKRILSNREGLDILDG